MIIMGLNQGLYNDNNVKIINEIPPGTEIDLDEVKKPEIPLKIKISYPNSPDWEYRTEPFVINLDQEAKDDIESGLGFPILSTRATNKKDMKNPDGIYSPKFGQKLGDMNPYADRYSCECGTLTSRVNHGIECPICHTKCKFVDDNFKIFGWIILKDQYHIIHPKFYRTLDYIFGTSPYNIERKKIKGSTKLQNMLNYSPEVDQDGNTTECAFKPDNEPFYGIGMMEFYERFDEILDYYYAKNPKKKDYYDEIQQYRDIIFCHSIPVFTTYLRPSDIKDNYMYYEPCNGIYNIINRHVQSINKNRRKFDRDYIVKNSELFKVQMNFMKLEEEIMKILTGKKGQLRTLIGGRFNFSCRAVIRQSGSLRIDQVLLPYSMLVKCLQQKIINLLIRSYNINPSEAYIIWSRALVKQDPRVCEILDMLIHANPEGLPII